MGKRSPEPKDSAKKKKTQHRSSSSTTHSSKKKKGTIKVDQFGDVIVDVST